VAEVGIVVIGSSTAINDVTGILRRTREDGPGVVGPNLQITCMMSDSQISMDVYLWQEETGTENRMSTEEQLQ
jgi:hypothetical protein